MLNRILFLFLFAFVIQLAGTPPAAAQNPNPCFASTIWYFPDPLPFGWWIAGPGQGPYSYIISAMTTLCVPSPECPCSATTPVPQGGKPIFFGNGDTVIEDTDISLPGLGGGLTLHRAWNSVWPANEAATSVGIFGPNWRSTYEERFFLSSDGYLKYSRGDGSYWSFGLIDPGNPLSPFGVVSPKNARATLISSPVTSLTFVNNERRQFDSTTGRLTAIIDPNGNTTHLSYDSSNRLVTVTSPASQHLYFNYQNGSGLLVTSITSDFGVTYSYSYDSQGRLTTVTRPDQTTVNYTYNALSQITQVTDSNGKVLETHTYDSTGRGLTSSEANGVNALSVTYSH